MVFFKMFLHITYGKNEQQYKNNKPKMIAPTCNAEFELLDSSHSVSGIQDYIEYIIKNM